MQNGGRPPHCEQCKADGVKCKNFNDTALGISFNTTASVSGWKSFLWLLFFIAGMFQPTVKALHYICHCHWRRGNTIRSLSGIIIPPSPPPPSSSCVPALCLYSRCLELCSHLASVAASALLSASRTKENSWSYR